MAATGSPSAAGLPRLPAEAGDVLDPDQDPAGRSLVELHPDLGVGPQGEAGEKVVLDLFDLQVVGALRADADHYVDARVVLVDRDPDEVGAFAQLVLSAELGQDAAHFCGRQHQVGGKPEAFVKDLGALDGPLPADYQLDDARTGPR